MKNPIIKPYICSVCGYLYDEQSAEKNIEGVNTPFEELPTDWICPNCGVKPDLFNPSDSDRVPDMPESKTKEF